MANVDAPNGFTPAYHMTGGMIRTRQYTIASAYNTSIFTGDVVTLLAAGTITQAVPATEVNVIGVFAGVQYKDTGTGDQVYSPYWPADEVASDIRAMVWDDPMIVYRVQTSGTLTDPDDIGGLFDLTNDGSGSTVYGRSTMEIDGAAATGSGLFRMIGPVDAPDNDPDTANAEYDVIFSGEHEYLGTDGV